MSQCKLEPQLLVFSGQEWQLIPYVQRKRQLQCNSSGKYNSPLNSEKPSKCVVLDWLLWLHCENQSPLTSLLLPFVCLNPHIFILLHCESLVHAVFFDVPELFLYFSVNCHFFLFVSFLFLRSWYVQCSSFDFHAMFNVTKLTNLNPKLFILLCILSLKHVQYFPVWW